MAASSSGRRRKGDEDQMIKPMRGGASSSEELMCKKHQTEVCQIFCETCDEAICVDCLYGDHKGHVTVRVKDHKEKLRAEVKLCETKLSAQKALLDKRTNDLEQNRVTTKKDCKDKLDLLRKEYEQEKKAVEKERDDRLQELQCKIDTSKAEVDRVDDLLDELRNVNDSTSMSSMMSTLQDMKDVVRTPGQQSQRSPLPKTPADNAGLADLRRQLLQLVQQAEEGFTADGKHVAVLKTSICELRDFADGTSNAKPSPLKCPAAGHAYKDSRSDSSLNYLPLETAGQIATLVGADPLVFVNRRRPKNMPVLTTQDNKLQHVHTCLREQTGARRVLWWYLPVGLKVSEAVRLALGYTPARVQDAHNAERHVEREMLLEVWDKGLNDFKVWDQ